MAKSLPVNFPFLEYNYPFWEDMQLIHFIARKVKKNHIPASDTHE